MVNFILFSKNPFINIHLIFVCYYHLGFYYQYPIWVLKFSLLIHLSFFVAINLLLWFTIDFQKLNFNCFECHIFSFPFIKVLEVHLLKSLILYDYYWIYQFSQIVSNFLMEFKFLNLFDYFILIFFNLLKFIYHLKFILAKNFYFK